jgi:hypothetical protein
MERKSRTYILLRKDAPLSLILRSRGSKTKPLLYFDGERNREILYSPNQKSVFKEEQDGNIVREPIIFEDGMLHVSHTNPILQQFLDFHPDNSRVFVERDPEKEAEVALDRMNAEVDALIAAKSLEINMLETVARVALNSDVDKMSTKELKRDVLVFAKNYPAQFLEILNDPLLRVQDIVARSFEEQIIKLRNKNRDVYFNLPSNKSKMLTIPFGENRIFSVAKYLQSDDGIETLKLLEKNISTIS